MHHPSNIGLLLQNALGRLGTLLDSPDVLRALDQATIKLGPKGAISGGQRQLAARPPPARSSAGLPARLLAQRSTVKHTIPSLTPAATTWPGLVSVFAGYAVEELKAAAGKKRGPDPGMSKTLRKLVQLAEDDRRSGGRA